MEGDAPNAGAVDRLVEALPELRGVEGVAGERVGEDEVLLALESRALEVVLELRHELRRERDGSAAARLR